MPMLNRIPKVGYRPDLWGVNEMVSPILTQRTTLNGDRSFWRPSWSSLRETVFMHLPPEQVNAACGRLPAILKPGGVLYLSWRASDGESRRDGAGRLVAAFDARTVAANLRGAPLVASTETINASSGRRVHRLVVQRA